MTAPRPSALVAEHAEEAVLGAVLAAPEFAMPIVSAALSAKDFTRPEHRTLYIACERLNNDGVTIDPITLHRMMSADVVALAHFKSAGKVAEFLGYMLDAVPTAANVRHHVQLVQDASRRRDVAEVGASLVAAARDGALDMVVQIQQAFGALLSLSTDGLSGGFQQVNPGPVIFAMEERGQNPKAVVRTGYRAIDDEFHGYREGELHIIGGSAKSGKTALAINMAINMAEQGHGVGFVECEMSREALTERMLNNVAGVHVASTTRGRFTPEEAEALAKGGNFLRSLPIEIDDTAMPSLDDVSHRVMELKARKPKTKVVVVDFLQLITSERKGTTAELLTAISYGLAALAKRAKVAIIAPCQLNYKDIDKDQREPEVRDLQGSSGMVQAATSILLVWREALPAGPFSSGDRFHLKCAASRRTPLFRAVLEWHGKYMRVSEPAREARSPFGGG